jgi:hypothetical protein
MELTKPIYHVLRSITKHLLLDNESKTAARMPLSPNVRIVPLLVDVRVSGTLTRHILRFDIPLPASTESDLRNLDKAQLRADILAMRDRGMSYRKIGAVLGVHWTRVGQIARMERNHSETG